MGTSNYLRYPHLHEDLVTFVAENDVWVAPISGGRAWRISAMQLPAKNPRFSPDGQSIAWTVIQAGAPEVVAAHTDGGEFRRLTYWGHPSTRVKGFTPDGDVLATSAFRHEDPRLAWAYRVPLDGSAQTVIPWGPVDTVAQGPAVGDERPVVVGSVMTREQAWWKRYRGGTAGKLWIDDDGNGDFVRFVPELDGNLSDPMWLGGRIAFLSDHEGHGNLYSVQRQGTDLRRHTDHDDFYVRHASTDGSRIVFESAGRLWILDSLDSAGSEATPLDIRLGSASTARRPHQLDVPRHLVRAAPTATGTASIVESHGTLHWLAHKDGPSRTVEATAGVRARLGIPLDDDRAAYVADHDGEEALFLSDVFEEGLPGEPQAPSPQAVEPGPRDHAAERVAAEETLPQPVTAMSANGTDPDGGEPATASGTEAPDEPSSGPAEAAGETPADAVVDAQRTPGRLGLRCYPFSGVFRASTLVAAPNGSVIALGGEKGELLVFDTGSETYHRISATPHGPIEDISFSADSRWLTWAEPASSDSARTRIRVAEAMPDGPIHDITDGRFKDHSPAFTRDGAFLAFLSERSFDPVYDTHRFDLSFPASTKPFLVALAADTPSPFGPAPHTSRTTTSPRTGEPTATKEDEESTDATPEPVRIDPERISERIIAIPVGQGSYRNLCPIDGGLLWTAAEPLGVTGDGRATLAAEPPARRLERFDFTRRTVEVLTPEVDSYRISGDGTTAVVLRQGKLTALPTKGKVETDSPERVEIDLSRIRVMLDPVRVWRQAFEETGRLQRDFFWAAGMGGLDWAAVRAKYRPLLDSLGSHDDLVDVLWELHGELGTSHAYVMPRPIAESGGQQGFLGAELVRSAEGWVVERVFAGESSDPHAASPLSAPGVAVREGDVILAVDGVPVPATQGPAPLLTGAAGRTVELTIRSAQPGVSATRRVAVIPLRSEERLRYQSWVAANRAIVHQASAGRFGYLHIPDMVANGWAQLHRDLDRETARDALVVDVRRNRGGHTSQLVAELIGRKVNAWSFPRDGEPGTYPAHAPRGPVVVLTDEFAGSDGDIITQVAKIRGIGPVVGMRTWGGVVGIDGRFALADGTGVTQPRYAFWMTGGAGWTVENRGVDPDIEVPFPPHAYAAGEDPQLEHSVGILREMLAELPTDVPPAQEDYPRLRAPGLPPRPGTDAAR